jgi:6-phosphofructokinase 1
MPLAPLAAGARVAILTSGGDAPGMNAALRAAARVGQSLGFEMIGVADGYEGLIAGSFAPLDLRALDEAARRGGTILGTARSPAFRTAEGRARAQLNCAAAQLSALIVIGGNGSLGGALALHESGGVERGGAESGGVEGDGVDAGHRKLRVAGIPASIDNDLACTSMAIGVDTALNTIVDACDRILDTAAAHRRTFIVEVMGRDCGYLAMTGAVAAGADAVLLREVGRSEEEIVEQVARAMETAFARDSGKRRVLVVKSEGVKIEGAQLKAAVEERVRGRVPDVDTRVTVLGHVVRGGAPTAFDRLLAARLANVAVRALADGESGFMSGWIGPGVAGTPSPHDPYVVNTPLPEVLAETERLMRGDAPLAQWRKRVFEEAESILLR